MKIAKFTKNNSLIFSVKSQNIQIEKSLFLGRSRILNNNCIVIYGSTLNQDKTIEWELKETV